QRRRLVTVTVGSLLLVWSCGYAKSYFSLWSGVISSPLPATWGLVVRRGSVCYSGLVTFHSHRSVHGVKNSRDLSSMAAPPLLFCPTFVMSSSLQGRVALYRCGDLFE
ncbi:unnamed protein product, partial [Brassica rapa subsp. narinosa]